VAVPQPGKLKYRRRPIPPSALNDNNRWPYSSSYQIVPAAYSPDQAKTGSDGGTNATIAQGGLDSQYLVPKHKPFGERMRRMDDVKFSAAKVCMYDAADRHSGATPRFYAHPLSRQPLMFCREDRPCAGAALIYKVHRQPQRYFVQLRSCPAERHNGCHARRPLVHLKADCLPNCLVELGR
jgi:hypothetical protein